MTSLAQTSPQRFVNKRDAARRLGVGIDAVRAVARSGQLPVVVLRKRELIPIMAVDRLLTGHETTATENGDVGEDGDLAGV